MTFKELKQKTISELHNLLAIKRDDLRELRFKDANKQLKTVHRIGQTKQEIAWILTLLNAQKPETVKDNKTEVKVEKAEKNKKENK